MNRLLEVVRCGGSPDRDYYSVLCDGAQISMVEGDPRVARVNSDIINAAVERREKRLLDRIAELERRK